MDKTYLKKTIPLCAGILTDALGLSSCGSSAYKQYADNPAKQVASILRDNQCLACHAVDAPVPFYASVPIAGPMVKTDMLQGTRFADFTAMVEALENDGQVTEVDLAKVENAVLSSSMPPAQYSHVHWGTSLDDEEKAVILAWAKAERKARFASPTVAEAFANEQVQPLMESIPTD